MATPFAAGGSAWPVWRSEGGVLLLPTGVFAIEVLRADQSRSARLPTVTAETGHLSL